MERKPIKVKNNYCDGTPNPEITGFQYFNCHKDHAINTSPCSISVISLRCDMGKWPSEIQKIIIKWNWCSNVSDSRVSDHLDCFYYDLDHERCTMTPCSKSEFLLHIDGKFLLAQNSTRSEATDTVFAVKCNPHGTNKLH